MRTWDLISELPVELDGYELVPHEIPFPDGSARRTTVVRLRGGDLDGLGEDVTYDEDAQGVFQDAGPEQPLQGSTTSIAPVSASSSASGRVHALVASSLKCVPG